MSTSSKKRSTHSRKPLVSIVIPVFNDEEYIARALETATKQSLKNIEIVCVDDNSTDTTIKVIEQFTDKDSRIKLVKHSKNESAFQARLSGIQAAQADYILFLDGDDELHKDAAKLSYTQAARSSSDIVGFGSRIVREDGSSSRSFEQSIQPAHKKLTGSAIISTLFEPGKPAQGSLWRYLFSKKLLEEAYSYFPENQQIHRTNDLPISFLAAALAKKYTSISNRLYVYHFYAGGSGGVNFNLDKFKFYTKAVDSINLLKDVVESNDFSTEVKEACLNARLFVISNILRQVENNLPAKYHKEAIHLLQEKVSLDEITLSMASFIPESLDRVRENMQSIIPKKQSKNIAIYTNNLSTGGVQGVVVSQAKYLHDAGYNVTIVLLKDNDIVFDVPKEINIEHVKVGPLYIRLHSFGEILQRNKIDTLIDHNILYNFSWPFFNLIAKHQGIKAVAWIHSFSLRPLTEGNGIGKFLIDNVSLIDDLVVLSKADVSYWKSLGHKNVSYLPNPPSPLLLNNSRKPVPKKSPKEHLNIVWLGRLQQATKKIYSLIDIAVELKKVTDDFTLSIVGPDGYEVSLSQLKTLAKAKGVEDNIRITGPKYAQDLLDEIEKADIFISTSIIEGYPLTITEVQSYALPVVMYELPWLAVTEGNDGIIQTAQNNPSAGAQEICNLFADEERYEAMSQASLNASSQYLSFNFSKLYTQLLERKLPKEYSPGVNVDHLAMFARWTQILLTEPGSSASADLLRRKDAEIAAIKNSKAMKLGNIAIAPLRLARKVKHRVARHLSK